MSADRIGALTLCAAVIAAAPAVAQEGRQLNFGLSANIVHDTNVARSSKQLADLRGVESEDTIFTPAATFDVVVPLGRQAVFASGLLGYDFYQRNDNLNRERLLLNGGLSGKIGPCAPSVTGSYVRAQSDLRDVTLLDPTNTVQTKSIGISATCARPAGFGFTVSGEKAWSENSSDFLQQADYERNTYSASLNYGRPTLGTLRVFTQFQDVEYPNKVNIPGFSTGFGAWNTGVGFERKLGARIQGDVSVSYNSVEMDGGFEGAGGTYDGVGYAGNLEYRATSRLDATFNFSKQITPSIRVGDAYTVQERIAVRASYDLTGNLALEAGAESLDERYRGQIPIGDPRIGLTDSTINTLQSALTYKPSDRLAFRLSLERQKRDASNPLYDYTSNRIGLRADLTF